MKKMYLIFAFAGNCYWSRRTVRDDTLAEVMVGVGSTLAMATVVYWTVCGVFKSVSELVKVKGIGVALIEKNRDSITVDTGPDSDC